MTDESTRRFCPQCGSPVSPGARFCGTCGRDLGSPATSAPQGDDATGTGATRVAPRASGPRHGRQVDARAAAPTYGSDSAPAKGSKGLVVGIAIAVAAGVVALGVLGWWWFFAAGQAPEPIAVPLTLQIDGFDGNCTTIPVQVTGSDEAGAEVSEVAFVDPTGAGIALAPGTYTLAFPASPLTPSGVLYYAPTDTPTVTVALGEDGNPAVSGNDAAVAFAPSTALDETEEMIQTAYDWAVKDPAQAEKAAELRDVALRVHGEAVAQKQAEEEAARQAEEERQRQEEEARRQQEAEQQQAASAREQALAPIQGTWTYMPPVGGTLMNIDVSGDQATIKTLMRMTGEMSQEGPYTIELEALDNDEYSYLYLLGTSKYALEISNYDPSVLRLLIGSAGDEIMEFTRAS